MGCVELVESFLFRPPVALKGNCSRKERVKLGNVTLQHVVIIEKLYITINYQTEVILIRLTVQFKSFYIIGIKHSFY